MGSTSEGGRATAPFEVILVWKFSRFTRKREHAVAFKSMLRRKGIRVVSITEHADDSPTGKLMEAIIESVDEVYSENLAQEVVRGMREAASRGYFLGSRAPFGYKRVKVHDGVKERPTLEVDPEAAPIVQEIFESSMRGNELKEICKDLNNRGITNKGKRWQKNVLRYLLTNESYTGTAVWGLKTKDEKGLEPVRVENAWTALVSRETFDLVQQGLRERAPTVVRPGNMGSKYLLSGLLRCGVCGKPYASQGAKSGQFAYYVCASLFREGAGACTARYLNATKLEDFIIGKVRERILTEETITELVTLVAEEIDVVAKEQRQKLETIEAELVDVKRRMGRLYDLAETTDLDIEDFKPRIRDHRERQEKLETSAEEARALLSQRKEVLDDVETITAYAMEMSDFLNESELTERRAFIESFVKEIVVMPDNAVVRYTIPMPDDSPIPGRDAEEMALNGSVLSTVKFGGVQERSLSDKYREDAVKTAARWPFTASPLRQLAAGNVGR